MLLWRGKEESLGERVRVRVLCCVRASREWLRTRQEALTSEVTLS